MKSEVFREFLKWQGIVVLLVLAGHGLAVGQDCAWEAASPTPVNWELRGVAYFQGRFYAAGSFRVDAFNLEPLVVASTDGRDWVTVYHPGESGSLTGISANQTRVVAVGGRRIVASTDGSVWSSLDVGLPGLSEVEWLGDRFYAVGDDNRILYSASGFSWSTASVNATCSTCGLTSVARKGSTFVAAVRVLLSENGVDWGQVAAVPGEPFLDLASNQSVFLGLGSDGDGGLSPDGLSWEEFDPPTLSDVYHVGWDGMEFRAFGEDGLIMRSPDGLSWTFESSPTDVDLRGAAFHGGMAVAVGFLGFPSSSPGDMRVIFQDCVSGAPDLRVSTGSDKSVLSPGEEFQTFTTVFNQGEEASAQTLLRLLLSNDGIISPADTLLGTAVVPSLEPGLPANIQRAFFAPGPGNYFLGSCVDIVPGENNTPNNCSTASALTVCGFSISPTSRNHSASGGFATIGVNVNSSACEWSASESLDWVSISSGASGSGPGTVTYSVSPNNSTAGRSGVITVAGHDFMVRQAGVQCAFSITPTGRTHGSAGGDGFFDVIASPGCSWTATENLSWVTIGSGSGNGDGKVRYSVSPNNSTSERSGTINVAGKQFTVRQSGASCSFSISPSGRTHSANQGQGVISVDATMGCSWSASEALPWVSLSSSGGTGSGSITYFLTANTLSSSRSGTIFLAEHGFAVSQLGAESPPQLGVFVPLVGHGRSGDSLFSSSINLMNLASTAQDVIVEVFDDDGFPAPLLLGNGLAVPEVELLLEGTAAVSTLSPNSDELQTGWVLIRSRSTLGIQVVFRIDDLPTGNLQTAANVRGSALSFGGTTFAAASSEVDTGVALLNPPTNQATAQVKISLLDSSGQVVARPGSLSIAPGHKVAKFITELLGVTSASGSIEIRSSVPIAILPLRQEGFVLTTQDLFPLVR